MGPVHNGTFYDRYSLETLQHWAETEFFYEGRIHPSVALKVTRLHPPFSCGAQITWIWTHPSNKVRHEGRHSIACEDEWAFYTIFKQTARIMADECRRYLAQASRDFYDPFSGFDL